MRYLLILAFLSLGLPAIGDKIPPELLDQPIQADVIILGEVHDNPVHHQNQARAVAAIKPAAIVLEMLTAEQAGRVTAENRSDAAALAKVLDWQTGGWPDFAMYHPILMAAPKAVIFGGGLPRDQVRRAVREGALAVFGTAQNFGLDQPLEVDEQALREDLQMQAHCNALPKNLLPGMIEAQRLRDAALAAAVLAARAETGGPVVLITGNGHARRDWGVPRALAQAAPDLSVQTIAQFEETAWPDPPFDAYLITPAAPRDDPCAAFTKN